MVMATKATIEARMGRLRHCSTVISSTRNVKMMPSFLDIFVEVGGKKLRSGIYLIPFKGALPNLKEIEENNFH